MHVNQGAILIFISNTKGPMIEKYFPSPAKGSFWTPYRDTNRW